MIGSFSPAPELAHLEAFHAVCAEGGFTAAARRLGCSQPAVTYRIQRLEALLGVDLIERGGRRLVLTAEGRRVRALADRIMEELAQVRRECASGEVLKSLRIGSASGFGRYVLVPALQALRHTADGEGTEIRLEFDNADVILDRLEAGAYDAAFVYKRRVSSLLSYEAVYDEELVLIGSPARIAELRAGGTDRIEVFESVPFVTYEECEYVFGRWFEASFGTQPGSLSSASHFTELEEVIAFVRHGAGLSIIPRDAVRDAERAGDVEVAYAAGASPCLNQVFMVVRSASSVRPELRRLAKRIGGGPPTSGGH